MKNIVAYQTEHATSRFLIELFANGINEYSKTTKVLIKDINEFLKVGFPSNINGIIVHGILRGTGLALKEAKKRCIDRFYIDHSYFVPGYSGEGWNRISRNSLTANYFKSVDDDRWNDIKNKVKIEPWKSSSERGKQILIIPPTHAVSWFYQDKNWLNNLILYFKQNFNEDFLKRINIRKKPKEPVVDKYGNLLGLRNIDIKNQNSIEDDLENAAVVIAFNSHVSIEATLKGIPVIVDKNNPCWNISYKLSDINEGLNNYKFDQEPDRLKLFKWLCYCQYNINEVKNGLAWELIEKFKK